MAIFWVIVPCSHCPDDGGDKYFQNIGTILLDYMLQRHRRRPSPDVSACRIFLSHLLHLCRGKVLIPSLYSKLYTGLKYICT